MSRVSLSRALFRGELELPSAFSRASHARRASKCVRAIARLCSGEIWLAEDDPPDLDGSRPDDGADDADVPDGLFELPLPLLELCVPEPEPEVRLSPRAR